MSTPSTQRLTYDRGSQAVILAVSAIDDLTGTTPPADAKIYSVAPVVHRGVQPFNMAVQVDVDTSGGGTLNSIKVSMLGSLDGVHFYKFGADFTDVGGGIYSIAGFPFAYVSACIPTYTKTGTAPVVTVSFTL